MKTKFFLLFSFLLNNNCLAISCKQTFGTLEGDIKFTDTSKICDKREHSKKLEIKDIEIKITNSKTCS